MSAPDIIKRLVDEFHTKVEFYKSPDYDEAKTRQQFIDPFFEALGWSIRDQSSTGDVVYEARVNVDGRLRRPDYGFRVGQRTRFFGEAKKPSVDLNSNRDAAFQVRSYGWSATHPVSVLTDFEEFSIYDCRIQPHHSDGAAQGRVDYIHYQEYEKRWDEIEAHFSKTAVLNNQLEAWIEGQKQRGTLTVDQAFLSEMEAWRVMLANDVALHNPGLTPRQLNMAVQATIDRIVFLRICEDREIEHYGTLQRAGQRRGVYSQLVQLFQDADKRYNSGLFHFQKEPDRDEPDILTLGLAVSDDTLEHIINRMYYPNPYAFDVIPADILGQIYERFLGKVIELQPGKGAVVVEKPDVRKAGGVYYTPTYIVDYIVQNTVGQLVEGKTPDEVAKLKVLDPACGSGSFLLGAFQFLLDWHLKWYEADGIAKYEKAKRVRPLGDVYTLTTHEKKRILVNNLYGVDLDQQAVEVTKLSLLLKVLEGETAETTQLNMFKERVLPDLDNNIKWGNSLIGPDFYVGKQMSMFDDEATYRMKVFDWKSKTEGFGEIIDAGGFDAVIGNPPYLNIDDTWGKGDSRLKYIKQAYSMVYNDKTDILFYFWAKAILLSKGFVSFIVSRAFLEAFKANKLRGWLASQSSIEEIVDFQNYSVFHGVGIATAIVTLSKTTTAAASVLRLKANTPLYNVMLQKSDQGYFETVAVPQSQFSADAWLFAKSEYLPILRKLDDSHDSIGDILIIGQGMQTGTNDVFGKRTQNEIETWSLPKNQYFLRARNSDIARYHINDSREFILYLEDVERFDALSSAVQMHLITNEQPLKKRAAYQRGNCEWWKYTWPLHKKLLARPKLYCPYLAATNRFALDQNNKYLGLTDTTVLYSNDQPESMEYLLGLLNSRLLSWRFKFIGKLKGNEILEYFWNSVSKLPIRRINFDDPNDRAQHDKLVNLVVRMLDLHPQLTATESAQIRKTIQSLIDQTDREIDILVYELYNLTDEEIAIVEGRQQAQLESARDEANVSTSWDFEADTTLSLGAD